MLLIALKRRWPILTTVGAGLLWLLNNYSIRGLDGLRLESRSPSYNASGWDSLTGTPAGFPTSLPGTFTNAFPSGPSLPSTSPTALWPPSSPASSSPAEGNMAGTGNPFPPLGHTLGNTPGNTLGNPMLPSTSPGGVGYAAGYPAAPIPVPSSSVANSLHVNQFPAAHLPQPSYQPQLPQLPPLPGNVSLESLRPAAKILMGREWDQLLSVGEKLGMLDQARQPAQALAPPTALPPGSAPTTPVAARRASGDTLRIASFNVNGWGDQARDNPAATELIVRILSQYDLVALQDIRSRRDDLLPNLIERLNTNGRRFDYLIGPRVGRGQNVGQMAFIFDTQAIETDRFQLYTVADPEDMLGREPLVGWFRAKQIDSRDAFTFSLVNMHIDSALAAQELAALPNLLEAVYSDGRGEDDIILVGDFSAAAQLSSRLSPSAFRIVLEGVATTTRGTDLAHNFVIPLASTTEFTGRAGVLDFLRQYNLTLEQALSVSEHLPIWAEFSIIEGGRPGQVAVNPGQMAGSSANLPHQ